MKLQVLYQEYLAKINENIELNLNKKNLFEQIDNGDQNEQIKCMHNGAITALDFKNVIFESSRALIAKLYILSILNRAHVQEIIELISEFFSGGFIAMLRSEILSIWRAEDQRQYMQHLIEMFNIIENVFEVLKTETQRVECTLSLKVNYSYICSQTYRIGISKKNDKSCKYYCFKTITVFYWYKKKN